MILETENLTTNITVIKELNSGDDNFYQKDICKQIKRRIIKTLSFKR